MKIFLVHTDSETISTKEFQFTTGDIVVLCIRGWLRFLIKLAEDAPSDWDNWKCIEQVVQSAYLPKNNIILFDSDGMRARNCDRKNMEVLCSMFEDDAIKAFINNVLSYASFKEERLEAGCIVALVHKPGIVPSKERVPPPQPIIEPIVKLDAGPQRPKAVIITPEIKAQGRRLQEFISKKFFGHFFPDEKIMVEVYFNSDAFPFCEQHNISYPKEFLIVANGSGISQKKEWIESFTSKRVKVINNNLLCWEDIK